MARWCAAWGAAAPPDRSLAITGTIVEPLVADTADGTCPLWLHLPAGDGPWPAVVMLMDAPGIRPALHDMAARLAAAGHAVALPDLFYRAGPYAPIDPRIVFTDPTLRAAHRARFNATLTPARAMADLGAVLDRLAGDPRVRAGPVGVVGYCMGGRLALIAAGTFGRQVAVAASFHAGNLADGTPSSPHLLAGGMTAEIFVAGAEQDANFPDAQKALLESSLAAAGVRHRVETWPARHGWVPRDTPAHDPAQAERHWDVLLPLLRDTLAAR